MKIDGNVEGDIEVKGTVIIGRHGNIKGNIISDNVELHGRIEGNITARNNLMLFSTAQLYGDASMKNFNSATGAVFVGNCIIIEDEPERKGEQVSTGPSAYEENREISKEKFMEESCDGLAINMFDRSTKEDEDDIKEGNIKEDSIEQDNIKEDSIDEDSIKGKVLDDFIIPVHIREIEMEPVPAAEKEQASMIKIELAPAVEAKPAPMTEIEPALAVQMEPVSAAETETVPVKKTEPAPEAKAEPAPAVEMDEKESEKSTSGESRKKYIIRKF